MTAEHPETGTLRQALEAKIEAWQQPENMRMKAYECADELESLLDEHRGGEYEVPVKETGGGSE